jgi:hypothetical protein
MRSKWLVLRTESVEGIVADVEFFWDPVCPWAWITSRWMVEVQQQRGLDVSWRFISLRMINADKDYERDFPPGYVEGHGRGLRMLRVAAAAKADGTPDRRLLHGLRHDHSSRPITHTPRHRSVVSGGPAGTRSANPLRISARRHQL